jgi:hypothetical protein
MNDNEKNDMHMEGVVLRQIQTTPNRRILSGMPSFRVESGVPDAMADMLRLLERAEARRGRAG